MRGIIEKLVFLTNKSNMDMDGFLASRLSQINFFNEWEINV